VVIALTPSSFRIRKLTDKRRCRQFNNTPASAVVRRLRTLPPAMNTVIKHMRGPVRHTAQNRTANRALSMHVLSNENSKGGIITNNVNRHVPLTGARHRQGNRKGIPSTLVPRSCTKFGCGFAARACTSFSNNWRAFTASSAAGSSLNILIALSMPRPEPHAGRVPCIINHQHTRM
jgi:hypothetical protein